MSLSKSKCWYTNNCLHFLKRAVPLIKSIEEIGIQHPGSNGWTKQQFQLAYQQQSHMVSYGNEDLLPSK